MQPRTFRLFVPLVAATLAASASGARAAQFVTFAPIVSGDSVNIVGISNTNVVLGNTQGTNNWFNGVTYTLPGSTATPLVLADPSYAQSNNYAYGISGSGIITGTNTGGLYTYSGGVYTQTFNPGNFAFQSAVNNSGVVVGYYANPGTGWIYNHGTTTSLAAPYSGGYSGFSGINNNGLAVGYVTVQDPLSGTGNTYHLMTYNTSTSTETDLGAYTDVAGLYASLNLGVSVNDSGTIIGTSQLEYGTTNGAWKYSGGTFTSLLTSAGVDPSGLSVSTVALAIDTAGDIVGNQINASNVQHAVIWNSGSATATDLNTLFDSKFPSLASQWTLTSATGINDNGWIIGLGTDNGIANTPFAFNLSDAAVPEPASIGVICVGAVALLRRRR